MGIITNLSGMQIGFLGKPYNNWHFCLTFKACCWIFILSLCIFMLNSDSGKSSPGLDFGLQLLLSPLCSNQVAPACCCSGTAGVRFFSSSCLFFFNSTSVLNASCKSPWTYLCEYKSSSISQIHTAFIEILVLWVTELWGTLSMNSWGANYMGRSVTTTALQEESSKGCRNLTEVWNTPLSLRITLLRGLKVSRLRGRQTGLILDFSWV